MFLMEFKSHFGLEAMAMELLICFGGGVWWRVSCSEPSERQCVARWSCSRWAIAACDSCGRCRLSRLLHEVTTVFQHTAVTTAFLSTIAVTTAFQNTAVTTAFCRT